jgi:hypothetical protein
MRKLIKCLKKSSGIILLFVIMLCFSCCSLIFVDTRISPEKPPLFDMGDTLVFRSTENVDSFHVELARLYKVNEDDGSREEWDIERYYSTIKQIDCIDSCYGFRLTIRPYKYAFGVLKLGYSGSKFHGELGPEYSSKEINAYIGGKEIKIGKYRLRDLYECKTNLDRLSDNEINTVLFSKKYGVVQYILNNEEIFQLSEESLKMLMARE